jgi:hypothetical protein
MRIVMAGASGFLGSRLAERLRQDAHVLTQLVRREPTGPEQVYWRPQTRELDPSLLAGADAVINLAGAGVGDRRWTHEYKQLLRSSRVDTTATIAAALARLDPSRRPRVLLNASAVGFYGDTGDTTVDEAAPAGHGFLADLCQEWESATTPAQAVGVRVVALRTGFPLDVAGGLLKPLARVTRLGLGGRLGNGRQWLPIISMPDWLAAVEFALHGELAGPVNLVGPHPVRNAELVAELARQLHRPAVFVVPGPILRVVLGEFATEALVSQRVLPGALTGAGFRFTQPTLTEALSAALRPGT